MIVLGFCLSGAHCALCLGCFLVFILCPFVPSIFDTICCVIRICDTICCVTSACDTICCVTSACDTICCITSACDTICCVTTACDTICYVTSACDTICFVISACDTICCVISACDTICCVTSACDTICCVTSARVDKSMSVSECFVICFSLYLKEHNRYIIQTVQEDQNLHICCCYSDGNVATIVNNGQHFYKCLEKHIFQKTFVCCIPDFRLLWGIIWCFEDYQWQIWQTENMARNSKYDKYDKQ